MNGAHESQCEEDGPNRGAREGPGQRLRVQAARQQPSEARRRDEVDDKLQPATSLCLSSTLLTLRSLSGREGSAAGGKPSLSFT